MHMTFAAAADDRIEELEAKLAEQIEWVQRLADDLIAAEGREARIKEKLAKAEEHTGKIVEAFRINMMRLMPEYSPEEFDALIRAIKE